MTMSMEAFLAVPRKIKDSIRNIYEVDEQG